MKLILINSITLILLLGLISCTKRADNPEQVLRDFIEIRFKNSQDIGTLLTYATGDFKTSLETMTDRDIEFFTKHGLKKRKLEITNSICQESTCSITYIISLDEYNGDTLQNSSELKKIAKLELVGEDWKISDITNIKTYHDLKEPIDVTPKE